MRIVNYYSDEFKLKVIRAVLSGEITKEEARRKYGIRGKSAVLNWLRKYGLEPELLKENEISLPSMEESSKKDIQKELRQLEAEKAALEEQLKLAQLKIKGYEIMIKMGKEKFGVDLEKKDGAKQSRK